MIKKAVKLSRVILEGSTYVRVLTPTKRAKWIVERIQDLGPTYIKLGQFLSSRSDFIDADTIAALKGLQDSALPLSFEDLKNSIRTIDMIKVDENPIASASIGQVHRGVLLKDGTEVVIKVRRPGIVKDIRNDIELLNFFASLVGKGGESEGKSKDTLRVLQDVQDLILKETDFVNEVMNMRTMATTYPDIMIPIPLYDMCDEEVIIMTYVPSVKFSSYVGDKNTRSKLAYLLMDRFIQQFLQRGVIHGDPHEGNVALSSLDSSTFVMYDLGNLIQLDASLLPLMKILVFELMTENVDGVVEVIEKMPQIIMIKDKSQVRQFVQKYITYIKTIDIGVLSTLDSRDADLPVQFSSTVFELIRVFGTVEGICISLDKDFAYDKVFYNYVDTLILDRDFLDYKINKDIGKMMNMFS